MKKYIFDNNKFWDVILILLGSVLIYLMFQVWDISIDPNKPNFVFYNKEKRMELLK
jgi:hypothetical protein